MYPFAHSCDEGAFYHSPFSTYLLRRRTVVAKDAENLYEATLGAAKKARSVAGKVYETGAVCDISYSSMGDSVDWTYAEAKVRWSFSLELRDLGLQCVSIILIIYGEGRLINGTYSGFLLPAAQIRPTGEELLAMLLSLAEFVLSKEG